MIMVENMNGLSPELLVVPGETLLEVIEARNMSQKELAVRTGLSTKHINHIIKGYKPITCATAVKLENALSVPASFWNNLESNYCEELTKYEMMTSVSSEEMKVLKQIPCKELKAYGYINQDAKGNKLIALLRKFLGVTNLLNVNKLSQIKFRQANVGYNIYSMLAWLKICEIESRFLEIKEYDKEKLKRYLPRIRELTLVDINSGIEKLTCIFSECGVAFNVVRNIKDAPVQGMIRKLENKITLCLTIRLKYADIFWFTLFHEIGHLLNDDFEDFFVDFEKAKANQSEVNADNFASETLIPKADYERFVRAGWFSKNAIIEFANMINIHSGVVVGRLQHDGYLPPSHCNDLRLRYEWE